MIIIITFILLYIYNKYILYLIYIYFGYVLYLFLLFGTVKYSQFFVLLSFIIGSFTSSFSGSFSVITSGVFTSYFITNLVKKPSSQILSISILYSPNFSISSSTQ